MDEKRQDIRILDGNYIMGTHVCKPNLDIGVSGQANCIHSFASALLQLYILCVGDTHKLCQVFSKLLNDIERFFNSRPT